MEIRRSLSAREQIKKVLGDWRAFLRHKRTSTAPLPTTANTKMSMQSRPKTGSRALGSLGTATNGGIEYSWMNCQRERLEAFSMRSRRWAVRFILMIFKGLSCLKNSNIRLMPQLQHTLCSSNSSSDLWSLISPQSLFSLH